MTDTNTIEVLPPSVVEKIAAGEVVERPASVLKELVENSIDAGATRIDVTVEDAGFSMMRVSDNGCGMSRADLAMCALPHATSKIRSADDLYSIATMGFRGEALASISAVSRMSAASSDGAGGLGYEITVEGGVHGELRPVSRTRGTTITVRDIFYNVPARKKFMKTPRGEQIAVIKIMEQIAMPFPGIRFTVTVDGKKAIDLPAVNSLRERICSAAGNEFARGLIECDGDGDGMSALVFVSSPEKLQPKPRFQSLYVNLRRIDNDSVTYAIREAFSKYLGHGNKPSFFCFLDVDPERTDVNVHPTKQQMKFDDERSVFGFIFHTVKEGLRDSGAGPGGFTGGSDQGGDGNNIPPPVYEFSEAGKDMLSRQYGIAGIAGNNIPLKQYSIICGADEMMPDGRDVGGAGGNDIPSGHYNTVNGGNGIRPNGYSGGAAAVTDAGWYSRNAEGGVLPGGGYGDAVSSQMILNFPTLPAGGRQPQGSSETGGAGEAGGGQPWDLVQCYQIHGMFILAPIKNGILLIDQHAAHERVLYEQALLDLETGSPISQQLLFPIVLEMSGTEKAVLESGKNYFSNLGFEISDFGGDSVSVSALPAFLKDGQAEETVRGMVRYLLDGRGPDGLREPLKRFAAAFACGAAIKTGQKLSREEMNALINQLFSARSPYTCPHGRPTIVRMSLDELERRFLRQGV